MKNIDTGVVMYTIPAPFMYDAKKETSDKVGLEGSCCHLCDR